MDNRPEVRDFLMSRRGKVSPAQIGLPTSGNRRVSGLRRSEVAAAAGVSVEYYTRLERGNLKGVSSSVLDAIASALALDDTERAHLDDLARAANVSSSRRPRRAPAPQVPEVVQRIVDGMPGIAAFVQNCRFDILHANTLGRALFSEVLTDPVAQQNPTRFLFLSPAARRFYLDWERVARGAVGALRVEAGRNPYDKDLASLIGELSVRSDDFRVLWGANDVHVFREGSKGFHHPVVGDLRLDHAALELPGQGELLVTVYNAAAGTPAADGLRLLASWAASQQATEVPAPHDA